MIPGGFYLRLVSFSALILLELPYKIWLIKIPAIIIETESCCFKAINDANIILPVGDRPQLVKNRTLVIYLLIKQLESDLGISTTV